MSATPSMVDEIRELNLSYLVLAQRMLRDDKATGMFRLGLSGQVAEILANLSMQQVMKLASSSNLLCRFRFEDHAVLSALCEKSATKGFAHTHAALLLAGQPVEQIG